MTGESGAAAAPSITLNGEHTMPVLGLGVAELSDDETERAVSAALEIGCRLIDTAYAYGNEAAVGRAIAASGVAREELFVTTKLATPDQGFTRSQEACRASLDRLGIDQGLTPGHFSAFLNNSGEHRTRLGSNPAERAMPDRSACPTSPRSTSKTLSTSHSSRRRSTRSSCTRCSTRTNCAKLTPSTPSSHSPTAPWHSAGCWTTQPSHQSPANTSRRPHKCCCGGTCNWAMRWSSARPDPSASPATSTSSTSSWRPNTWMHWAGSMTAPGCARIH
ncbi:oxidoreductase [Mycobacterium tuberculosis T17]|nr:oxidoreductase [Mycobacterium tuberculosis T17]